MRYDYDETRDTIFIRFREGEYGESEEIYEGFVIDFDKSGRPLGLDIYIDASKFIDIKALQKNVGPPEHDLVADEAPKTR
jgi:uncharacterized protein YuzE